MADGCERHAGVGRQWTACVDGGVVGMTGRCITVGSDSWLRRCGFVSGCQVVVCRCGQTCGFCCRCRVMRCCV